MTSRSNAWMWWAASGCASALIGCGGGRLHGGAPAPVVVDATLSARFAPAFSALDSAIAAGAAPGAVLAISFHGARAVHAVGKLGVNDARAPSERTVYDMASLTKVIAMTTLAMMAVSDGRLALDSPVVHYLPQFARGMGDKTHVLVRDLLLHDSGLPPDPVPPLWTHPGSRGSAIDEALASNLDTLPGTRFVYSDVGAMTMGAILESLYHERLDSLFADRVARPLGLERTRFLPPREWMAEIAPTEIETTPFRADTALRGEVHDENAWRLGGVSGHAGLFSDAQDLLRFGEWVLAGSQGKLTPDSLQPPRELATWTRRQNQPSGSSRGLGWDTPSEHSSAGSYMTSWSFGHTGFTGTSIWVDPEPARELVIVLLTNRVNPTRNTPAFGSLRAVVADAVVQSLFPSAVRTIASP